MKTVRSKPVKKNPLGEPKPAHKGKPIPKAKSRILGVGTFQKKEHAPRVV